MDQSEETGKNIIFKLLLYFIFCLLISCNNKSQEINLDNWKNNKLNSSNMIFRKNGKICFYDGLSSAENSLIGNLKVINNKIFFNSTNIKNLNFLLFDFDLKVNQCEKIKYFKNDSFKEYFLCLEDKFYNIKNKDTVYKFYFKNYYSSTENSGIIYFVLPKFGISGSYLIDKSKGNIRVSSNMLGETYNNRYNYDTLERFSVE